MLVLLFHLNGCGEFFSKKTKKNNRVTDGEYNTKTAEQRKKKTAKEAQIIDLRV